MFCGSQIQSSLINHQRKTQSSRCIIFWVKIKLYLQLTICYIMQCQSDLKNNSFAQKCVQKGPFLPTQGTTLKDCKEAGLYLNITSTMNHFDSSPSRTQKESTVNTLSQMEDTSPCHTLCNGVFVRGCYYIPPCTQ